MFYIVTFNFLGIPGNFSAFPGKFPVVASEAVRSHLTSIVFWLDMMEGTVSPRQYHSCGTFELDGRLIGIVRTMNSLKSLISTRITCLGKLVPRYPES